MLDELPAGCPPGPSTSEAEQRLAWFSRPYDFLRECASRYGERFTVRMSGGAYVIVSDPDGIREIFRGAPEDFHAGEGNGGLRSIFGSSSLMLLDGDAHLRQRKLLLPAFHGARLADHGRIIQGIATEVSAKWPLGPPFPLLEGLLEISQEVILRAIFGMGDSERHEIAKQRLRDFMGLLGTGITMGRANERFRRVAEELDVVLGAEIARRRETAQPGNDVLALLLSARHDDGTPLSDVELRDQLVTLMAAGHETTGTTLASAFAFLVENPATMERLVAEVDSLGPDPAPEDLVRLPYVAAVCNETLRMWPVVPIVSRWLPRPVRVAGMDLPGGMFVSACVYLAHRRPAVFPEPDRFLPERFLERDYQPQEFLPFGGGVRRCVGMGFALYEMKLVLARLLALFRFENGAVKPFRPVRHSVVVGPSESARMKLALRATAKSVGQ